MLSQKTATLDAGTTAIRNLWANHDRSLLRIAIAFMAMAACVWLGYEFWRLLLQAGEWGAVDLRMIQAWVKDWFTSAPPAGLFPPASYAILWPLMGWLAFTSARWLWALTTVAALAWLACLAVRHTLADTRLERTVALLMPLSMYATGAAIGNGQLVLHIMPLLITGLVFLDRRQRVWRLDLFAATLVLIALVKPNISVPFLWIVLFVPRSLRPVALVALGYLGLTWFAMSFKDADLMTVLRGWFTRTSAVAGQAGYGNVSNVNVWLSAVGLEKWILPTSVLCLTALGGWLYEHRRVDLWLRLGVTAYVTRLAIYHRWYDDLLLLLPMIALFRIAKQETITSGAGVAAGVLLVATMLVVVAPGGLFLLPPPFDSWYVTAQVTVWIIGLVFLAVQARYRKSLHIRDEPVSSCR
jgi:hypothetical protein